MLIRSPLGLVLAVILTYVSVGPTSADPSASVIGSPAPEWHLTDWIDSAPTDIADLRGKVVLVRWWTAPDCPFCAATAPALNEWYERYSASGFTVIGVYHHKASSPLDIDRVRGYSRAFGFRFPIAIDTEWRTLNDWWLGRSEDAGWTSVSFLIDREGIVRHIHPGGQYAKGEPDHVQMQRWIEALLGEP